MNLSIPLYIESGKDSAGEERFTIRPLFFLRPLRSHNKLEKAMNLVARDLREMLRLAGKEQRHDELAQWTFAPPVIESRVNLTLELRRSTVKVRLFFVRFECLGRSVAFSPAVPEVWFEVGRGEDLAERATETLRAHFREREKEDEDDFVSPETLGLRGTAWVAAIDLEIDPPLLLPPAEMPNRAGLGGKSNRGGADELRRVGRCLDELYPDDLDRVIRRDREVEELMRLLREPDRRPIMLLGPPLVGKTALLHEYTWRTVHARRDQRYRQKNNVWLLSPQRLISGMTGVGEWENRLLAILQHARKRDHILYFDDLLGMYHAGQSSQSDLSIAHVLKPYIERREVRLVAEMTPEALRVFREHDRGFADLFHLLPVREPDEDETLRILLSVVRQLETQHHSEFAIAALPTAIDLVRRFVRNQAFPGKAAVFLRRLAVKHRKAAVNREIVLAEFQEKSGLSLDLLDGQRKLAREEIVTALAQDIIGQQPALEAATDIVSVAKARLNDTDRPLAALLFLGPTGVGKTQTAKALAKYLFGDSDRLLRFDMNEFTEPGSAARLAGTFDQPEGLLTGAVRRQPFAVVLLDEIEKANPEVFDLLLQVLGEGRLSDALGRTVDFTSAIVILTSNLGVREALQKFGIAAGDRHDKSAYEIAAQRFFRPEFFNRLDRVVPFERLTRNDVGKIARHLIADLLRREGLVRRKCVLRIEPEAMERIVSAGFDPVLGARALKRAVERQLALPVAERLAAGLPETITLLSVYPLGDGVTLSVEGLEEVPPLPASHRALGPPEQISAGVSAALTRIEARFAHLRPRGAITAASVGGDHLFYFVIQEQVRRLRRKLRELGEALAESGRRRQPIPALPSSKARIHRDYDPDSTRARGYLRQLAAAMDIDLYLKDVSEQAARSVEPDKEQWLEVVEQLALLEVLADASAKPHGEQVLLVLSTASAAWIGCVEHLVKTYRALGFVQTGARHEQEGADSAWWRLEVEVLPEEPDSLDRAVVVRGLAADRLTAGEVGSHLFALENAGFALVQVQAYAVDEEVEPGGVLESQRQARRDWLTALAAGESTTDADPLRPGPVVRLYRGLQSSIDIRSGMSENGMPPVPELVLAMLPLSGELRDATCN